MAIDRLTSRAAAFSRLIVGPDDLMLLRLCLYEGVAWRGAWDEWLRQVKDPKSVFAYQEEGLKGLLPLLAVAAQRAGYTIEPSFQTYLRTAYLREKVRFDAYTRACRSVLAALGEVSLQPIVLRGSAFAESVYPDASTRHSHGLRLLWRRHEDLLQASALLQEQGLATPADSDLDASEMRTLTHRSLMPIFLQERLFPDSAHTVPVADLWARSRQTTLAGVQTLVLSEADSLLEVCGRAAYQSDRGTLRWACDAWLLIERCRDLDWNMLGTTAADSGLAFPTAALLRALRRDLHARIPDEALARVFDAARRDPLGPELTFRSFRIGEGLTHVGLVRRARRWRDRAVLARDLLFPSTEYMAWFFAKPPAEVTFQLYWQRLWRFSRASLESGDK